MSQSLSKEGSWADWGKFMVSRRLTLCDKLLLTLASLLVVEAGVRAVLDWSRAAQTQRDQFMSAGRNHVRNVAYTARDAFAARDDAELERVAELLRTPEDKDLIYVAFYTGDGNLLAAKTWLEDGMAVPARVRPVHEPTVETRNADHRANPEHYAFMFPIVLPSTDSGGGRPAARARSGVVVAVRSCQEVKAKVAKEQVAGFLVTATMLAVCLNVLLVFTRRLVAPVEELVKGTRRLAAGDFNTPVDVGSRRDELRTLADSFNHMTEQLASQRGQLLAHSQQLEERVEERTGELVATNDRLRQTQSDLIQSEKMRMLGQLAAGVAHEINTPTGAILNVAADAHQHLGAIVNAASRIGLLTQPTQKWVADVVPKVLARGIQPSDAATRSRRRQIERDLRKRGRAEPRRTAAVIVKCGFAEDEIDDVLLGHLSHEPVLALLEHLEAMVCAAGITRASGEKIGRIVRALRLYTRGEQDGHIEVDINETLDNTLAILQNRIKQSARVRTDYARDLPPVRCGVDIAQIWTNLLNNACDAIEDAHPEEMGRIDIVTALEEGRVRVRISNSGNPVPDEVRQKIFDPFFTTKAAGKGTGLGLGICSGILGRCGGTIRTWNDPDGVSFEVTLPPSTDVSPEEPTAVGAAAADGDGHPDRRER